MNARYLNVGLFAVLVTTTACPSSKWTEERRQAFDQDCRGSASLDWPLMSVEGYPYAEVDTVWVEAYRREVLVDSFFVYPREATSQPDVTWNRHDFYADRKLFKGQRYAFYFDPDSAHVLDGLRTGMVPQYTMGGEGWGCAWVEWSVDGIPMGTQGSLHFTSRNPVYPETP